jgi:hypothetical protein
MTSDERMQRESSHKIAALAVFAVLALALYAQQSNTPSPETSPQIAQPATSKPKSRATKSIKYKNTKYGFTFSLPATWKGYSAVEGTWGGGDNSGPHGYEVSERGPEITLVNPNRPPQSRIRILSSWCSATLSGIPLSREISLSVQPLSGRENLGAIGNTYLLSPRV